MSFYGHIIYTYPSLGLEPSLKKSFGYLSDIHKSWLGLVNVLFGLYFQTKAKKRRLDVTKVLSKFSWPNLTPIPMPLHMYLKVDREVSCHEATTGLLSKFREAMLNQNNIWRSPS